MSRHIIFLDPLETIKTSMDSSIFFAKGLQRLGYEVYFLFARNFHVNSHDWPVYKVFSFSVESNSDYTTRSVVLNQEHFIQLNACDILYMRLNPPLDARFSKILWMLKTLEDRGLRIVNSARSMAQINSKAIPFAYAQWAIPTWMGSSEEGFQNFAHQMQQRGYEHLIFKPLDQFKGIGVERVELAKTDLLAVLRAYKETRGEQVIVQPFLNDVYDRELRVMYGAGKFIAAYKKIPPVGHFIGAYSRGGGYVAADLSSQQQMICQKVADDLYQQGISWIGFDLIGNYFSEVNFCSVGSLIQICQIYNKDYSLYLAELLTQPS